MSCFQIAPLMIPIVTDNSKHCFLFVFIKQKAQYVMRISDLSTNVCSSDLNNGQICVVTKRMYVHRDIYEPLKDALVAYARTVKEIGRASCRERVCQYV